MSTTKTPELEPLDKVIQLSNILNRLLQITQGDKDWAKYMWMFEIIAILTRVGNQVKKACHLRGLKKELTVWVFQDRIPNQFESLVTQKRKHVESMKAKEEAMALQRVYKLIIPLFLERKRKLEENDNNLCFYCREPRHQARHHLL